MGIASGDSQKRAHRPEIIQEFRKVFGHYAPALRPPVNDSQNDVLAPSETPILGKMPVPQNEPLRGPSRSLFH